MPVKFTEIPNLTRQGYNVISMNFQPIWPLINARSNLTGRIGCKSIEIMTTKFDQAGIQCKGFRCRLISVDSHPIWPVINAQSNLTGRIGCKSIEIMTTKFDQAGIQCKGFRCWLISMNVYPIWPVINAQSNLTSQIGCKSIEIDAGWIHWDDAQFDQAGVQCNLNEKWIQSYTIHLK